MSIDRSFRLPRHWSNHTLHSIAPLFDGEVINVSGWDDRDKEGSRYREYFSAASGYFVSNHSGIRGIDDAADTTDLSLDLTAPVPAELQQRFDVVYNHTTLEHVFDVFKAFSNLCLMSRDIVIVVVPFAQEMHFTASYGDYWRFTPMAVRELFRANGLDVVFEDASPHRYAGIYLLSVGSRRPTYWHERLPAWEPVNQVGGWIASPPLARRLARRLRRFLRLP